MVGILGQCVQALRVGPQQLQDSPCPGLESAWGFPPPLFCPWIAEGDSSPWGTWHGRDWSQGLPRELL